MWPATSKRLQVKVLKAKTRMEANSKQPQESDVERALNYCRIHFLQCQDPCLMRNTYKYPIVRKALSIDFPMQIPCSSHIFRILRYSKPGYRIFSPESVEYLENGKICFMIPQLH